MENYKNLQYSIPIHYIDIEIGYNMLQYDTMSSTSSQSSVAHAEVTALTLASKTPW